MVGASQLYRLSLATFDESARLWHAVDWHLLNGFRSSDLCLLGTEPHIQAIRLPESGALQRQAPAAALTDVMSLGFDVRGYKVVATTNRFLSTFKQAKYLRGNPCRCMLTADSQAHLLNRAANGAVALIANASSPEQHVSSTQQLLQCSLYPVQTHLFVWPMISQP